MKVTAIAGTTYTVARAFDNTSAAAHSAGATIEHSISADDMNEFNTLAALANAKGDIIVATAADAWTRKAAGADDTILMYDSAQADGLKAAAAATTTEIANIAAAEAAGTSDTWARGDHVHAHPDLTASALGHAKIVRKTADETVNNSATLQNDDTLLFAIAANEVWAFEIYIDHIGNNTANIKFAITVPTAATLSWSAPNTYIDAAGGTSSGLVQTTSGTAENFHAITTRRANYIKGICANGANAGNVQLQWAQNTATVVDTIVKANSYLVAHRIA